MFVQGGYWLDKSHLVSIGLLFYKSESVAVTESLGPLSRDCQLLFHKVVGMISPSNSVLHFAATGTRDMS